MSQTWPGWHVAGAAVEPGVECPVCEKHLVEIRRGRWRCGWCGSDGGIDARTDELTVRARARETECPDYGYG